MLNKWGVKMTPSEILVQNAGRGDMQPLIDALRKADGAVFAEASSGNTTEAGNVPESDLLMAMNTGVMDGELTDEQFDALYEIATG